MSQATIRLATQADTLQVVRVIKAVYDEYGFSWDPEQYHADLYDLEGHYHAKGDFFWIAEENGIGLGTVALDLYDLLPGSPDGTIEHQGYVRVGGTDCSLERLYVHPDARNRRLGSQLTQTAIDQAKALGRTAMELWSDKRFGDAHRLYGRFGATVVGERICDDPDESPEWGLSILLHQSA